MTAVETRVSDAEMADADKTEEYDKVVREIDVCLMPKLDDNMQLYLFQYPLRPSWRPYNLEERCQEVRIKPKQKKVEVDLVMDTTAVTHDEDAPTHLQIRSQTLSSSRLPLSTSYAIGLLRGKQILSLSLNSSISTLSTLSFNFAHLSVISTRPIKGRERREGRERETRMTPWRRQKKGERRRNWWLFR